MYTLCLYFICYFYPLSAFFCLMRDRNPVDPDGRGGVEQLGQVGKGETNLDMGYEKKSF